MKETKLTQVVKSITMPTQMADVLLENCTRQKSAGSTIPIRSRLTVAAIALILLAGISTTSYAAYNLYQVKNVNVFFEKDISAQQLTAIEDTLKTIDGVYSIRYVSADEAWDNFKLEYLDESLAEQFTENPLKDSSSYRVTIKLDADTDEVRDQISQLEGVRKVSNLYESKEDSNH